MLPERRHLFDGFGEVDSFIVDPHKWFFCTAGTCALLYREPALAARTHTQHGPYIDVLHSTAANETWNPSDYAFQLTCRASGLPFWFTLLVHGTEAMTEAIRASITTTAYAAQRLRAIDGVELVMEPELTVILFRKRGWDARRWQAWARDLLEREIAFVAPTRWKGETVGRLVFLHPLDDRGDRRRGVATRSADRRRAASDTARMSSSTRSTGRPGTVWPSTPVTVSATKSALVTASSLASTTAVNTASSDLSASSRVSVKPVANRRRRFVVDAARKMSPLPWWATEPILPSPNPTRRATRSSWRASSGMSVNTMPMHDPPASSTGATSRSAVIVSPTGTPPIRSSFEPPKLHSSSTPTVPNPSSTRDAVPMPPLCPIVLMPVPAPTTPSATGPVVAESSAWRT